MANHTCNSNMTTDTKELVRVEPGGKKIYNTWTLTTCDICGKLAGKVFNGTVEE